MPKVSVIIPAYNQAQFLSTAINSVLAQTFQDFEVIVTNDGSTDNTPEILARYGERICVINQENAGLSAARNAGMRLAQGELVAFLDSDDFWYPDMLLYTVTFFDKHPEMDVVYTKFDKVNEIGEVIWRAGKGGSPGFDNYLWTLLLGNIFPPLVVVIRRACFDCCGMFDEKLIAAEDWDMWIRLAAHGYHFGSVPFSLGAYRLHSDSMSHNFDRQLHALFGVIEKNFQSLALSKDLRDLKPHAYVSQWVDAAMDAFEVGALQQSRHYLIEAAKCYRRAPCNAQAVRYYLGFVPPWVESQEFVAELTSSLPENVRREALATFRRRVADTEYKHGNYFRAVIFILRGIWCWPPSLLKVIRHLLNRVLAR